MTRVDEALLLRYADSHWGRRGADPLPELMWLLPLPAQEQPDRGSREPAKHGRSRQRRKKQKAWAVRSPAAGVLLMLKAWCSPCLFFQYLRQKNAELEEKYKDSEVPMPDYWWAEPCEVDVNEMVVENWLFEALFIYHISAMSFN